MTLQARAPASELEGYLAPGERVVSAVHQHWWALHREILAAVGATVLAVYIDLNASVTTAGRAAQNLGWLVWLGSLGWLAWGALNWRHDWFIVTDKRLLTFFGFIRRKVAMMPMRKVTDMTFERSPLGRLLGYGNFILESAGQQQALARIDYVPNANEHYLKICTVLFGDGAAPVGWDPDEDGWDGDGEGPGDGGGGGHGRGPGDGPGDGPDDGPGRGPGDGPGVQPAIPYAGQHERPPRSASNEHPWPTPAPRPTRTADDWLDDLFGYPDSGRDGDSESLYRSDDLVRSDRDADTGEIPVVQPRRMPPPQTPW